MDPARTLTPEQAPVILVDHAEQLPWTPFVYIKGESWILPTERAHLGTGDYAIKGLLPYFRIERKAEDLYSTLFGRGPNTGLGEVNPNQDRFRRELDRMNDPEVSGLVPGAFVRLWIEGTVFDVFARMGPHHGAFASKQPWELWNLLESIEVDYTMPVAFVGKPAAGGLWLGTTAMRIWKQATDPKAVKKAEKRGVSAGLPWLGVLIGKGAAVVSESGCSWCSFADGSTTGEPCNMCGRNGGVVVEEAKEDGNGQA